METTQTSRSVSPSSSFHPYILVNAFTSKLRVAAAAVHVGYEGFVGRARERANRSTCKVFIQTIFVHVVRDGAPPFHPTRGRASSSTVVTAAFNYFKLAAPWR